MPICIGYLLVVFRPKPHLSYSDLWCWARKFQTLVLRHLCQLVLHLDSAHGRPIWERKGGRRARETPSYSHSYYHPSAEGTVLATLNTNQEAACKDVLPPFTMPPLGIDQTTVPPWSTQFLETPPPPLVLPVLQPLIAELPSILFLPFQPSELSVTNSFYSIPSVWGRKLSVLSLFVIGPGWDFQLIILTDLGSWVGWIFFWQWRIRNSEFWNWRHDWSIWGIICKCVGRA